MPGGGSYCAVYGCLNRSETKERQVARGPSGFTNLLMYVFLLLFTFTQNKAIQPILAIYKYY